MIIYTSQKSRRKPQNTAKKQQQRAEWNALLKKYEIGSAKIKCVSNKTFSMKSNELFDDRSTRHIPSLNSNYGDTFRKQTPQYTGDAMLGISTLHKSNAIPIFSQKDAEDAARMRR